MTGNGFAHEDLEIAGTVWDSPFDEEIIAARVYCCRK
jgi:hypothetical protein